MKAILLGNAPSLNELDLNAIPRPGVKVWAVNRIIGLITPDTLVVLDTTVEDKWIPRNHPDIRSITGCKYSHYTGARTHELIKRAGPLDPEGPPITEWRKPGTPLYNGRNSACFAIQLMIDEGFTDIGLAGIQYSTRQIYAKNKAADTHWLGQNPVTKRSPGFDGPGAKFWTTLRQLAPSMGLEITNLDPHDGVPFLQAGFPRATLTDWLGVPEIVAPPPLPPLPQQEDDPGQEPAGPVRYALPPRPPSVARYYDRST